MAADRRRSGAPLLLVSLAGNGWLRGVQELRRPVRYVLAGSLVSLVLCPLLVLPGRAGPGRLGRRQRRRAGGDGRPVPARAGPRGRRLAAAAGRRRGPSWSSAATCCCAPPCSRCPSSSPPGWPPAPARRSSAPTRSPCSCSSSSPSCSTPTRSPRRPWSARRSGGEPARGGPGHRPPGRRSGGWAPGWSSRPLLLALRDVLLPLFTDDPAVLAQAEVVWWFLAAMQPLAGVVFALDGVLMGAGDVGYLRTVTIGSALRRLPAAVAAGRCRSAGGWPASGPGCACSSRCGWSASSCGWRVTAG